ncbi:uncharacterized protein LOC122249231 [Penaeus japonicus]|uniref:uncharacterized protein LOC122249231 n=1 Tax=Penaeus japonicus TaxID=27405 RepID=UPI001C711708|nr:uncharacterized protein LOC122249231 [Penaeus japonicus]XP_042865860.1 uncharacterized protein LOC122249231 [Penaeus japonicus]
MSYRVLLVAWATILLSSHASSALETHPTDGTKAEAVFQDLGLDREEFDSAVTATTRALISGDLADVIKATAKTFSLVTHSSAARQHSSSSFDPVIGFAILGGIIVAALAAWLGYILSSARRRRRRELEGFDRGLSLDQTAAILDCLARSEAKIMCLACVAAKPFGVCG